MSTDGQGTDAKKTNDEKSAGARSGSGRFAATKVLLTLLLPIVVGFSAVYIIYYRANAAYLTDRNYRVLASLSSQVVTRIEGARRATQNAAVQREDGDEGSGTYRRDGKLQPNLILSGETRCWSTAPIRSRAGFGWPQACPPGNADADCLDLGAETTALYLRAGRSRSQSALGGDDAKAAANQSMLPGRAPETAQDDTCAFTRLDVRTWLKSLLSRDVFDDVVLFEEPSGRVIYQRRDASTGGIPDLKTLTANATDLDADSTASSDAARTNEFSRYSQPQKTRYFGNDYLLFFQPVKFRRGAPSAANGTTQWLLCGLVQRDRFRQEVGRIPSALLGTFLVLVVLAALAWPTLNLMYVGPRERLSVREVRVIAASWFAMTGLMTFYVLDLVGYVALSSHFDASLQTLAAEMESRFRAEIGQAYDQLDQVRELRRKGADGTLNWQRLTYPDFENLMVVDGEGRPSASWVSVAYDGQGDVPSDGLWRARSVPKPEFNLSDRPYFCTAQSRRLPEFDAGKRFAMDVVQARTTGNDVLTLAIPVKAEDHPEVVLLGSRLVSLMRPVLPARMGMALVDSTGAVVLHSDAKRNRAENFLLECDGDRVLDAALKARHEAFVSTRYGGLPHEMYVRPVRGTDWSLIVFRDKTLLGTLNLEITASWAITFVLYLVFCLLVGVVAHAVAPGYRAQWLWPQPSATLRYLLGGGVLVVLTVCLVGGAAHSDARGAAGLVLGVPILATTLLYLILSAGAERSRGAYAAVVACIGLSAAAVACSGRFAWLVLGAAATATGVALAVERRYRDGWQASTAAAHRSYIFMLFALLGVVAAAPSLVIFLDAQAFSVTALVKYMQQSLGRAIVDRDRRIVAEFEELRFSDRALHARLRDQRDIYWTDLFATGATDGHAMGERAFAPNQPLQTDGTPSGADSFGDASAWSRHLTAAVHLALPLYGNDGSLGRRLQYDRASDGSWWWESARGQLVYVQPDLRVSSADNNAAKARGVRLQNVLPACPFPLCGEWWLRLMGLGLAGVVIGLAGLRAVVRRLFLFDLANLPVADTDAPCHTRTWLCAYPPDADLSVAARPGGVAVLDLAALQAPEECGKWLDGPELGRAALAVVDRAESHSGDAAWDAARLALLERLTALTGKPAVLLSEIELTALAPAHAADGTDRPNTAQRWNDVLARFSQRPVEQADWAGPLSAVRNRRWWAQCTPEERLALAQLAREGFLNPNNQPVVAGLFARGLIRRTPAFQLRDESFRAFVLNATPPETIAAWERDHQDGGGWIKLRTPLMALLLLAVVFFITTQREAVNWVVGVATAVTVAIPAMLRVVDLVSRPREAKGNGGGDSGG